MILIPPEGDKQEKKIDSPNKTSVEFKSLKPGQEYTIEVFTVFEDQESEKKTITARTGNMFVIIELLGVSGMCK